MNDELLLLAPFVLFVGVDQSLNHRVVYSGYGQLAGETGVHLNKPASPEVLLIATAITALMDAHGG